MTVGAYGMQMIGARHLLAMLLAKSGEALLSTGGANFSGQKSRMQPTLAMRCTKIGEALLMTGGSNKSNMIELIVCETSMRSLSITRRTNIVKRQAGSRGRTTFMRRRRTLPGHG